MVKKSIGLQIAVVDRGFVWIGNAYLASDYMDVPGVSVLIVEDGRSIRTWGVEKGLGQLALGGPTKDTVLDPVKKVVIPLRSVIATVPADREVWKDHIREPSED